MHTYVVYMCQRIQNVQNLIRLTMELQTIIAQVLRSLKEYDNLPGKIRGMDEGGRSGSLPPVLCDLFVGAELSLILLIS